MTPAITEISLSSTTNVRNHSEEYTKLYEPRVFEWLRKEDTINNNAKVTSNNIKIKINDLGFTANEESFSNGQSNEKESSSKEADLKEESFQEMYTEETFVEEIFRISLRESTTSSTGTSSSFYAAELVQTPHKSLDSNGSNGISENEILSPIKPLKAITTSRNSDYNYSERLSNIYEILQEIKPDHPLRINTQFDFAITNSNPGTSSSIIHNPLFHHHRNSSYNPSNTSRTSTNYISPRRYSNFQRSSFTLNNHRASLKSPITNHFEEETDNNFITRQLPDSNNAQEKNDTNDKILYGKIFFWAGFLFMPVWWLGCFYKPTSTDDYKWRNRCRKASIWAFVTLVIVVISIVIVSQRLEIGL